MTTTSAICWIARKDLRLYFRDRTGMVLGFLLPIVLITVFGFMMNYVFGGGNAMPRAALWIADEDGSPESGRFVEMLRRGEMVGVSPGEGEPPRHAAELREMLRDGEAHHALIIEPGFGQSLQDEQLPRLTMVRDPGRQMEDRLIRLAVMQSFMAVSEGSLWPLAVEKMMRDSGAGETEVRRISIAAKTVQHLLAALVENRRPSDTTQTPAAETPVDTANDSETSGGSTSAEDANDLFSLSNGMIDLVPVENEDIQPPERPRNLTYTVAHTVSGTAVMMLMFGLIACSTMLLHERENGTLQRLLVAGIPRSSIFWGKYVFSASIGLLQLLLFFVYGNVLFRFGAFRDPATLLVLSITWVAAANSFGMLVAAWAGTAKQAEGLSTLLILVMAPLGGCWFPVQMLDLPLVAEIATRCALPHWAVTGYQGMFWHQLSWTHPTMLTAIAVQWAFTIVGSLAALIVFRRRYVAG